MAILCNTEKGCRTCWACGLKIDDEDVCIVVPGENSRIYLHPDCGKSVNRRLLGDLNELGDLGFTLAK